MPDIESHYKKQDGRILIEITLSSVMQLFNSLIRHHSTRRNWTLPRNTTLSIRSRISRKRPHSRSSFTCPRISPEPKGHRRSRRQSTTISRTRCWCRTGNSASGSVMAGLPCSSGLRSLPLPCLPARKSPISTTSCIAQIFADALLIIGWAAMWEPITVLLYELWPIIQQKHTYEKISTMDIEILPYQ